MRGVFAGYLAVIALGLVAMFTIGLLQR